MKDIKLRIKSVESTMQITKAMELVASSKLRKAKAQAERTKPYFELLYQALADISGAGADFSSPFTAKRPVKKTGYVVIAGDRGLAGGYNSNLFKAAKAHMEGKEAVVLPIGKKAVEHFEKQKAELLSRQYAVAADVDMAACGEAARLLTETFLQGGFDELYLVYTEFVSMLNQEPHVLQVLPMRAQEEAPAEKAGAVSLVIYEPSCEAVFDEIVPHYIGGLLYGAMSESVASELGARRTAMDAATKNAGDMITDLSLKYNRARQGAITQEITEIVSGAEAQQ